MITFKKGDAFFFGLRHVTLAVNDTPNIKTLRNNILITTDGRAVGTDGHRLHIWKFKDVWIGLAPGIYEVKTRSKTKIEFSRSEIPADNYPDFDAIIPTDYRFFGTVKIGSENSLRSLVTAAIIRRFHLSTIDINYVSDAVENMKTPVSIAVQDDKSPVKIDDTERGLTAIVMPMRGNGE